MTRKHFKIFIAVLIAIAIAIPAAIASNSPAIEYGTYNGGSTDVNEGYKKYPKVIMDYFNENKANFDIPTFTKPGWNSTEMGGLGRATSQEDMEEFLESLPTQYMRMRYVAEFTTYDNSGNALKTFKSPLLVFSNPAVFEPEDVKALGKPILWIEGSIHGGEIAGTEAMLVLAQRLANGDLTPLLDKVTVIIWPRYNVDGVWKYQRGTDTVMPRRIVVDWKDPYNQEKWRERDPSENTSGLDQNRDNTGFESPITRQLHRMLNAYEPHFIGDAHQMGDKVTTGLYYDFDIATLFTGNPNVSDELNVLAHDGPQSLETLAKEALRAAGLEWWFYIGSTTTDKGTATYWDPAQGKFVTSDNYPIAYSDIQEGNPEEGITDTAGRLRGAFGLLTETRTPSGCSTVNYERRIQANVIVYETMIKAFADDTLGPKLKKAVEDARHEMATSRKDLIVKVMNGEARDVKEIGEEGVPVLRLVEDPENPGQPKIQKEKFPAKASRSRYVTVDKNVPFSQVKRPYAYIMAVDEAVAERLSHTGVRIERLAKDTEVEVEAYTVTEFGPNYNFKGREGFQILVSQLETGITNVTCQTITKKFPKDTFIFYMDHYPSVHAAIAVEPMSGRSFGNYWYNRVGESKEGFIPVALNEEYPVYRYMKPEKLETYTYANTTPNVEGTFVEGPVMLTDEDIAMFTDGIAGELITMSAFTVNDPSKEFTAYLPKTTADGTWYAWNWDEGAAVALTEGTDGAVTITPEFIDSEEGIVLFKMGAPARTGGGGGCSVGFGALALLAFAPFVIKRKK